MMDERTELPSMGPVPKDFGFLGILMTLHSSAYTKDSVVGAKVLMEAMCRGMIDTN